MVHSVPIQFENKSSVKTKKNRMTIKNRNHGTDHSVPHAISVMRQTENRNKKQNWTFVLRPRSQFKRLYSDINQIWPMDFTKKRNRIFGEHKRLHASGIGWIFDEGKPMYNLRKKHKTFFVLLLSWSIFLGKPLGIVLYGPFRIPVSTFILELLWPTQKNLMLNILSVVLLCSNCIMIRISLLDL